MKPIDLAAEIESTKQEFRKRWAQEWKSEYCRENKLFKKNKFGRPNGYDIACAPEPPWNDYVAPEFVGVKWKTGFAVITAEAFAKMSQTQINKLTGGKQREKCKNVRQR